MTAVDQLCATKVHEWLTATVNIFVFQCLPPQITVAFRLTYVLQKYQKLNLAMMTLCQSLDKREGLMHRREDTLETSVSFVKSRTPPILLSAYLTKGRTFLLS